MPDIIGVQFQRAGKIYSYYPNDEKFSTGDYVIVDSSRGPKYARVMLENHYIPEEDCTDEIQPIIRRATEEDAQINEENLEEGRQAYAVAMEKILLCGLDMKLVNVEYAFDRSRVVFNFTADERVDFRNLIKELAAVFHTRIELRQIGVRDEAKIVGGIGICGQPLCCHRYMGDFSPVSIKMAKEQSLSLNPTKISGCCGRLLCCLNYENEVYVERNRLAKEAAKEAKEKEAENKVGAECEECTCPHKNAEEAEGELVAVSEPKKKAHKEQKEPKERKENKARKESNTEIIIEEATAIDIDDAPKRERKPHPRRENGEKRERRPKDSHKRERNKSDEPRRNKPNAEKNAPKGEVGDDKKARRPRKRGHRGGKNRVKKHEQADSTNNG